MKKVVLIAVLTLLAGLAVMAQNTKTDTAEKGAESWLALVDKGDYEASYDQASSMFKSALTQDKWVSADLNMLDAWS